VLYIDIVCISLEGNIIDAAWASIVAGLHSTRLPHAFWDADHEQVVCDPNPVMYRQLEMRGLAFTSSFCIYSHEGESGDETWILSDPDEFEESVCIERVLVCIQEGDKIAKVEKSGGMTNVLEVVPTCIRRAKERYKTWEKMFNL
jgi:exosome complex component RRP43